MQTRQPGSKAANETNEANEACVVCGLADTRALVKTALAGGQRVAVCATHAMIHARLETKATTVEELRASVSDRRSAEERRDSFAKDELGAMLTCGFAGERRAGNDRRC